MNLPESFLSKDQLLDVFSMTRLATAIHITEDAIIQTANDFMLQIWGKDKSVIGKSLADALPELRDQPFIGMFKRVWNEGITLSGTDTPADLEIDGKLQTFYFDFEYRAIKNEAGKTYCILHTAIDITDRYLSKQREQDLAEELRAINEELTASNREIRDNNEELAAVNEELAASNEEQLSTNEELMATLDELQKSQEDLKRTQLEASENEEALQFAINAANLGTWDLDPATYRFKANDRLKSWFGLTPAEEVELARATDVMADYDRERVSAAINEAMTFSSGGYYDIDYTIVNPLDNEPRHVIAKGKALFDEDQKPTRFSGTLQDITEERKMIKELARVYEQAQLSKEAAQLGTFDMDLAANTLEWDERCRTLFGISHHGVVSYEEDFVKGLHADDRDRIIDVISKVFIKSVSNGDYDVEYRTVGAEDGRIRWVRAKGKALFDENDQPFRFIGSVLDITEQKADEQRKNDFIGMVSHELKTPLTSLSGYIQVLLAKADKGEDTFLISALNKSNQQIKKMNTMINGFLNVSRLESGKILVSKQSFSLGELLADVIDESRLISPGYTIELTSCEAGDINADREKIGSVVANLISNAVKYSPKGTDIELQCRLKDDQVRVSVKDYGIGIKPEDVPKLFERYYRVEDKDTRHISGFGIGLYLSAEIIHRHGGEIGVDSVFGEGSSFWFEVPVGM